MSNSKFDKPHWKKGGRRNSGPPKVSALDEFPAKSLGRHLMAVVSDNPRDWDCVAIYLSAAGALKNRLTTTKDGRPSEVQAALLNFYSVRVQNEVVSRNAKLAVFLKFVYLVTGTSVWPILKFEAQKSGRVINVASFCNGADDGFLRACSYLFGNDKVRAVSYGSWSAVAGKSNSFLGDMFAHNVFDDPSYYQKRVGENTYKYHAYRYDIALLDPALNEGEIEKQNLQGICKKRSQLATTNSDYVLDSFFRGWHPHLLARCYAIKIRQYNTVEVISAIDNILTDSGYVVDGVIHNDLDNKLEFYLIYRVKSDEDLTNVDMAASLVAALRIWMNAFYNPKKRIRYGCWLSWADLTTFVANNFGNLEPAWSNTRIDAAGRHVIKCPVRFREPIPLPMEVARAFRE
jgi:hypothetical protein